MGKLIIPVRKLNKLFISDEIHKKFEKKIDKNKNAKILQSTDWIDLRDADGYIYSHEHKNCVIILPYDINVYDELESIFFREEICPAHDSKNSGYYVISGQIEKGETPIQCCVKELEEEAGITVLETEHKRIISGAPLYTNKASNFRVFPFFVDVTGLEKKEPKTDGTEYEKNSKTIEADIVNIERYKIQDMQLLYLISMLSTLT